MTLLLPKKCFRYAHTHTHTKKKILHFTSSCRMNATLYFVGPLKSIQTCSEYPDAAHSCWRSSGRKKIPSDWSFMEFIFSPNNLHPTVALRNTSLKPLWNDSSTGMLDASYHIIPRDDSSHYPIQTQMISSFYTILLEVWTPWDLSHLMNHFNQLMTFTNMHWHDVETVISSSTTSTALRRLRLKRAEDGDNLGDAPCH